MIQIVSGAFYLHTHHTTYALKVSDTGHLEHLHYGGKLHEADTRALSEKCVFPPGNTIAYHPEHNHVALEDVALEISGYGKGDMREAFLEVQDALGIRTVDLTYQSHQVYAGKKPFDHLPGSYGKDQEVDTLEVVLSDDHVGIEVTLMYFVYLERDVISKCAKLRYNGTHAPLVVKKFMSNQVDFYGNHYQIGSFTGAWAREMQLTQMPLQAGQLVNGTVAGCSSSRNNPFVMLSALETTEDHGPCYGFNLIYSGNHYTSVSVSAFHKTRLVTGIHPTLFEYHLESGECFEAPESVMTYSNEGFNGMSHQMHGFVQKHIVRGHWRDKVRPILINSWEATYFDFNESKLLKLAKAAKEVGIELFVLDDGWFGKRNDDTSSLGDWTVNTDKLKHGLKGLGEKINALGMDFGIWVEPEMVNADSDCYREHPDWVLKIPGRDQALGRNQMILDLTQTVVQDYIITAMTDVFESANIAYVKWDMNRVMSDVFSVHIEPQRQGEVAHRYILGLYRVLDVLTKRFPKILFESCASGGNRFDFGMLCFMPQIWASDNTDGFERLRIQKSYSYGYPQSVIGAHVSSVPNHQTLRKVPLETRFHVAAFGLLGYECALNDMKQEELDAIKEQVAFYRRWREVLVFGRFYRLARPDAPNRTFWMVVSKDQRVGIGMLYHERLIPNQPLSKFIARGLNEDWCYRFTNRVLEHNIKLFGDLINMIAPVHIKQDSLVHNVVAHFKKMPGEVEDVLVHGDTLMHAGVALKQGFAGTGFNDQVRLQQDYASGLYLMVAEKG